MPFAFSIFSSTQYCQHPLRAAFSLPEESYDIATFHINSLASELGTFCIPALQCLRTTYVIKVIPGTLTLWLQPVSVFGCSLDNGTSTKIQLTLPCHSILAPDRLTLAVTDFTLTGFSLQGTLSQTLHTTSVSHGLVRYWK